MSSIEQAVDRLVRLELLEFERLEDVVPAPLRLYRAAEFVLYISSRFTEFISPETRRQILLLCLFRRARADYAYHGWFRVAALEAAQWVLTRDDKWLSTLTANINHESSHLRGAVLEPLILIAGELPLETPGLIERVESAIRRNFVNAEWAIALLLQARGPDDVRREWLQQAAAEFENTNSRAMLGALAKGAGMPNPALSYVSAVERWVLARLVAGLTAAPTEEDAQLPLAPGVLSSPASTDFLQRMNHLYSNDEMLGCPP